MSENIELDFRDTGADKYLVIYAAVRSFKDSSSTGESEVFYEINEKKSGLDGFSFDVPFGFGLC
ncbi:hypothetical protein [Phascolarctobacterium sp.]|uniref:hypothetical protein n=1 Tax=Phascolarctobacterium sp. TaxID=2049039 RepID=UPI0015AA6692|nr:hypothetical protein [uncultured Phascolarctobacterium sp.]